MVKNNCKSLPKKKSPHFLGGWGEMSSFNFTFKSLFLDNTGVVGLGFQNLSWFFWLDKVWIKFFSSEISNVHSRWNGWSLLFIKLVSFYHSCLKLKKNKTIVPTDNIFPQKVPKRNADIVVLHQIVKKHVLRGGKNFLFRNWNKNINLTPALAFSEISQKKDWKDKTKI